MSDTIRFSESAAERARDLLKDEPEAVALRVFVAGGGCSGMNYGFSFAEEIAEEDLVIETNGVKLVVDPMSLMYLTGATIDIKKDIMGEQFTIDNPNATSQCGCGHSFSTG